jgi:hypothetical protein
MLRKKEVLVVLLLAIFCLSTAWAEEAAKTRTITTRNPKTGELITHQVPVVPKEADPYEDTSVLVEAFMVRVSTDALAELGVNPIGQSPEGISILKIIACLDDPEKGEVVTGAKVTATHNDRSQVKNENSFYVKRETGRQTVTEQGPVAGSDITFESYEVGGKFSVIPHIQTDDTVRVEATFSYLGIVENEDKTMPPGHISLDWTGVVTARSGKPLIAAAAQNDGTITFLILTATIQEERAQDE